MTLGERDQQPFWEDILRVPAQDIHPHPENPRKGDTAAIADMIRGNGWHGVLVVQRSTGNIIVGNHRYRAGLDVGMDTFPVHYVDVNDEQAMRILLADNRASDVATYDEPLLLRLVAQVGDADTAVAVLADPQSTQAEREDALKVLKNSTYAGTGYRTEDAVQMALDLAPEIADDSGQYRTTDDMAERYEQTSVRQIMLIMSEEEFAVLVPAFKKVREAQGMDTNTDVVLYLMRQEGALEG